VRRVHFGKCGRRRDSESSLRADGGLAKPKVSCHLQ
jgi:hypothetical protein